MKKNIAGIGGIVVTAFLAVFCFGANAMASADNFVDVPARPVENVRPGADDVGFEEEITDAEDEVISGELEDAEDPKGVVQTFARESNIEQWDTKTTLLLLLAGGVLLLLILFMLARRKKL